MMPMQRGRIGRSALLVWVLLGSAGLGGLDEGELECEETVAKLVDCCPSFSPEKVNCDYSGCSGTPDIQREESDCIQDLSCEQIRARGLCERVPGAGAAIDDAGTAPGGPLCL